ncbi:MAG TPA: glycosyltransferase, partial [Ilumatobacter sp.]
FRFSAPVDGTAPGTVFGEDKYRLLARSRILLNLHRDDVAPGYFEWARMVEAMANGCAVLTAPSTGYEPLVDGKHFVVADDLAAPLAELLDDPRRCREIGEAARTAVLDEHPLVESLAPILDRLDDVAPGRPRRHRRPAPRAHRAPLFGELRPATALRRRVYVALMDEHRLQRHIDRTRCAVLHGSADFVERFETPAYADAGPAVSVIVTLYNYADLVTETLESLVASRGVDFEIVVVDDHSRDHGRAVVQRFMDDHPDVPMLLIASDVNRGLPASRNLAVAAARAERIMVMDADNTVYPTCLLRLSDALDADPTAAFAYATLEAFGAHPGLRSELGWSPRWLCESNYIDAQAMVRRTTYERHGGYRDDDDFAYGWEDWELWLRLADAGEHGVHVPQMLGRYRTQTSSMITITNLVADEMRAHIRGLHPTLPWPEHDRA